jgi:hypothetical protein
MRTSSNVGSLDGDAACLDGYGPFCDLALEVITEILRRCLIIGNDFGAEIREPLAHRRRVHRHKRRVVQRFYDRLWRAFRQEDGIPRVGNEIGRRALLDGGRHIGQGKATPTAGDLGITANANQTFLSRRLVTVSLEALPDGKIRANTSAWSAPKVILRNEVPEVRVLDGQLRLARKERFHDDGDPPVEPYDPYGPGVTALETERVPS